MWKRLYLVHSFSQLSRDILRSTYKIFGFVFWFMHSHHLLWIMRIIFDVKLMSDAIVTAVQYVLISQYLTLALSNIMT